MNAATLFHPISTLPQHAEPPRHAPRTSLMGAAGLALFLGVLAGSFLYDLARSPAGAAARSASAESRPGALARAHPVP